MGKIARNHLLPLLAVVITNDARRHLSAHWMEGKIKGPKQTLQSGWPGDSAFYRGFDAILISEPLPVFKECLIKGSQKWESVWESSGILPCLVF